MLTIYCYTIGSDDDEFTTVADLKSRSEAIAFVQDLASFHRFMAKVLPAAELYFNDEIGYAMPCGVTAYGTPDELIFWVAP